ncbi:MAG: hypothetical protein R6V57_10635 [Vicinamibacterales bacterium]
MATGREATVLGLAGRIGMTMLVLAAARGAAAQERPGALYVLGGVTVTHQNGAADGETVLYITAPGGTTAGWTVGGGVFVARHVSIEGEWAWTGMMTAREPARYGLTYIEERRDRVLGVLVRIHTRPSASVDVEPVAGVAAVWHDRWSTTEAYRSWLPPGQAVEVGPRVRYDTVTGAAFVGGIDMRLGSGRIAVVPGFRVRAATRGEGLTAHYPGGFPRWTIGGGVSARVVF